VNASASAPASTAVGATAADGGVPPAAPRFQMLGAAGLVCDGDVCTVPAQPAGAPAEGPGGVGRDAADG
jgi:hypothetical protein